MILRILLLTCAIFIAPSLGIMKLEEFLPKFESMCFQDEDTDPFRINGQDTPLSSTIENFIALAEKFEAANPSMTLKDQLIYYITEYLFENLRFVNKRIDEFTIGRANFKEYNEMWDPDVLDVKPQFQDPFTNDEKCSLYFMISHSVLKNYQLAKQVYYSPGNNSINDIHKPDLAPDPFYPQEIGVVAIRRSDQAVSLSKVLIGLYVGLRPKENRESEINFSEDTAEDLKTNDNKLDALYITTLADVFMRAEWAGSERQGLTPDGKWVSINFNEDKSIDGFCPMVYKQELQNGETKLPAYSYSSVRGAADGLILGLAAHQISQKKPAVRLSQLLRMYYSFNGITVEDMIDDIKSRYQISFCKRGGYISYAYSKLENQMLLYGHLISKNNKDIRDGTKEAKSLYFKAKSEVLEKYSQEITDYCVRYTSLANPEQDAPRETLLDVIVVMDSSNSENAFQEQQLITGHIASRLDLRHTGSRMTILLDQKDSPTSGTSSKIELTPVVYDTYSSSCAACTVGQLSYVESRLERDQVVSGLDQFLQERKDNETKYRGANGKVVIFFNYQNENERNNNKIQGSLEKALKNLHLNHQDITFYAVGLDSELLKKYAKDDPSLVFLGTDGTTEAVAERLFKKISFAPALLQYAECEDGRNEKGGSYENFVTPKSYKHYEMPAEYFYKSIKMSLTFKSENGYIKVCHSRATKQPENEEKNCKNTTGNSDVEFKISNPCKGSTKTTCSPLYFSIKGMLVNSADMKGIDRPRDYCNDINDKWCANLDQVKFKVSHTGIRCSGCLRLSAPSAIILFTILMTYFMNKRF